ncbi:MAG: DUF389 domain-containing protein [Christiangramia sp.]|nr:hypothetical protein [Christiangramia sp.]
MTNTTNTNEPEKKEDKKLADDAIRIGSEARSFISRLLDIRPDTDRESTLEAVKKDISFKGHNAWILIFSIFVASIGLNVGSTAVIIGAMLISPLMGPIVGVGMSVGINDVETLKRSLVNLGIMVGLSVLTATLYFFISPFKGENAELMGRTYPTILDVLVALFGGLALIVGKTKKGTIASVILGVAIATALMPPLCTVGYGIANAKWDYAAGALYLFSINAVFIALSTFLVVKLLGFPLVRYANSKRRRRTAQIASAVAIIVMIPSIILFVNLLRKTVFEAQADSFVNDHVMYDGTEIIKFNRDYESKVISVYMIGEQVPEKTINTWRDQLLNIEPLKNAKLVIHQGMGQGEDINVLSTQLRSGILEDLYVKNQEALEDKDKRIQLLENELSKYQASGFSFVDISKEAKVNYENIEQIGYSNEISTNFSKIDTLPTFTVQWNSEVSGKDLRQQQQKFGEWLKLRLKLDTLAIKNIR